MAAAPPANAPQSISPSSLPPASISPSRPPPTLAAVSTTGATSPATDSKPFARPEAPSLAAPQPDSDGGSDDEGQLDADDAAATGGAAGDAKRPRLRLAHACDRCRRRKIKCDTMSPCGPCQATRSECTFNTPSRRTSKPKVDTLAGAGPAARSASTGGTKRPHSPIREQSRLEQRLAALESMLRDVPPNVHNAFLSSLDARLGGGAGVGLKEGGGGHGVGVAPEALSGSGMAAAAYDAGEGQWTGSLAGLTGGGNGELTGPNWGSLMSPELASLMSGKIMRRKEDEGVDAMATRMEGMSFFYEDEIGQAKWQGATSGFPLLSLLTANANNAESNDDKSTSDNDTKRRTSTSLPQLSRPISNPSTSSTNLGSTSVPPVKNRFFPDRNPRPHQTLNPEQSWKAITNVIPPDLMDTLVRCYLSTSHLLWPFLHVPSFLADYANPAQWGEPGFACFIVAVCTLSSRHVDDPRVRANPTDPSTAGKAYFELFKRLRDFPAADRPTLYSMQAAFLAAIYAFGLGNLSKAFALQAESITLCLDGGLHRSVDGYDHFDAIEKETRKRTFWAIYSWDKQSAALFGRPPIIHLRDCDVTEPLIVDDDNLTPEGVKDGKEDPQSRLCAFVAAIRLHVILEGVIDTATQPSKFPASPFLARAAATIARRTTGRDLREEEELLQEWERILPSYWRYDSETTNSRDPVRITQAERLHCLQHLVKMIIYRHRFSGFVAMPAETEEERARHLDMSKRAMQSALTIVADHVHISQRGMMTYYGVHVIHQLAQAGRTLVAVILNCRNADFRPLIAPSIEGLRSCVGLLRRFSGRYLCGLRSADIIDEFCRICNIPVDSPRVPDGASRPSPAWLRPVRKRATHNSQQTPSPSAAARGDSASPGMYSGEDIMSASANLMLPKDSLPLAGLTQAQLMARQSQGRQGQGQGLGQGGLDSGSGSGSGGLQEFAAQWQQQQQHLQQHNQQGQRSGQQQQQQLSQAQFSTQTQSQSPNQQLGQGQGQHRGSQSYGQSGQTHSQRLSLSGDIDSFFNTDEYYNLASSAGDAAAAAAQNGPNGTLYTPSNGGGSVHGQSLLQQQQQQQQADTSPYAGYAMLGTSAGSASGGNTMGQAGGQNNGGGGSGFGGYSIGVNDFALPDPPGAGNGLAFDFGNAGFGGGGGEMLAGEGMDTVSDGLQGGEQGLSAATILSLLEEGSFDYGAMFTDQAPLPMPMDLDPPAGGGGGSGSGVGGQAPGSV